MQILLFFMFVFVAEALILTYGLRSVSRSPNSSPPRDRLPLRSRLLVVFLVGLSSGGWVVVPLLMSPGSTQYTALLFLVIPVLGGLWVATAWHGKHLKSYVLLGLLAGILATFVSTAAGAFAYISPDILPTESFQYVWWRYFFRSSLSVLEVSTTTMLFITGGIVGDWIERRRCTRPGGHQVTIETQ